MTCNSFGRLICRRFVIDLGVLLVLSIFLDSGFDVCRGCRRREILVGDVFYTRDPEVIGEWSRSVVHVISGLRASSALLLQDWGLGVNWLRWGGTESTTGSELVTKCALLEIVLLPLRRGPEMRAVIVVLSRAQANSSAVVNGTW